ncbi:MAG: hypothetical protein V4536_01885 [Pseudomonadota bacterium]
MNKLLAITANPVSMVMDKGFPSNGIYSSTAEIEYEGKVTNFGDSLYGYKVDKRGGEGSIAFLTIEFEDKPSYQIPGGSSFPAIGWLEVSPMTHHLNTTDNPILFNLRITLPNSDLHDLLLLGNNSIQIEPVFNWDSEKKFITYKSDELIQFYISRVDIKPLPVR